MCTCLCWYVHILTISIIITIIICHLGSMTKNTMPFIVRQCPILLNGCRYHIFVYAVLCVYYCVYAVDMHLFWFYGVFVCMFKKRR